MLGKGRSTTNLGILASGLGAWERRDVRARQRLLASLAIAALQPPAPRRYESAAAGK
jgi:hypothetical protein